MRFITDLMRFFTLITTGIVIVFFIYNAVIQRDTVPLSDIGKIIAAGFITALMTAVILSRETSTKRGTVILFVLLFVLISTVMVALGLWFDWIAPKPLSILSMILCVAFVYAFTYLITYFTSKKDADEINIALREKNNHKNNFINKDEL